MPPKKKTTTINIASVDRGEVSFCLVGTTPFLHNRMTAKAQQQLLLPSGSRRDSGLLKHYPDQEFRASPYRAISDLSAPKPDGVPTLIQMVGSAFRGAMQSAALELPNVTKASVGRLLWVVEDRVPIWGTPLLDMRIVRQAGINKTPDVRTRAIQHEWAARLTVSFIEPQFTEQGVANLLAAAGTFIGVGDGRNEKGKLTMGLWRLCSPDDPDFVRICKLGFEHQRQALLNPVAADEDTEELFSWWLKEKEEVKSLKPRKRNGVSKENGVSKKNGVSKEVSA